jgi:tetratricopeptide (TPR) repeat protein
VPLAQRYFDQGLILTYGFNHDEAISSFREAARLDPRCAICYWGVAFALGPNINAPMDPAANGPALDALREARARLSYAAPWQRAYIEALAARYSPDTTKSRASLDSAYASAMRDLSHRFPDDADAGTLYVDALMNLAPLVHMPAHIYMRVGRYQDAVTANEHAAHTDEMFIERRHPTGTYNFYYAHNLHFLWSAAQMEGRSAVALEAARNLERSVPLDALRQAPVFEFVLPTPIFALVRFGKWDAAPCCSPPGARQRRRPSIVRFRTAWARADVTLISTQF